MTAPTADDVLRWLEASGAQALTPSDRKRLKVRSTDRAWLLKVDWKSTEHIVVGLPPRFPCVLPEIMLPHSIRDKRIIPHVTPDDGYICYAAESSFIDPHQPEAMLRDALRLAEAVLEMQYRPEEVEREVLRELMPYWRFTPEFYLTFLAPALCPDVFVMPSSGKTQAPDRKNPQTFKDIGLILTCTPDKAIELILSPEKWIATNPDLPSRIDSLLQLAGPGGMPVKKSTVLFLISVQLPEGHVLLPARIHNVHWPKNRGDSKAPLQTIVDALATAELERGAIVDLSTERLMRRTKGELSIELLSKRVAIVGCGSIGGFVADNLARSGVRNFFLMDRENLGVENIPRHCADLREVGHPKVAAVERRIRSILPDAVVVTKDLDFYTEEGRQELKDFGADLIIFATGNTTLEIMADSLRYEGLLPDLCFTWVESRLAAAHMAFCPSGPCPGFADLIDLTTGNYAYHELKDGGNDLQHESGCQTAFAPYSGLDLIIATGIISRQIVKWLMVVPKKRIVLKFKPGEFTCDATSTSSDDLHRDGTSHSNTPGSHGS